jgi:protein-disulfide isomerase
MQKIINTIKHFAVTTRSKIAHIHLTTPLAIIIGSAIIACGLMGYGYITTTNIANSGGTNYFTGRTIDDADFVEGNSEADVFVVEYSDPECPFCVQVSPTIKELRQKYASTVGFVYRHFPLTQIHSHAFDESKAIVCAGTLGGSKKFYEYIDALYGYKISNRTTQLPTKGKEDIARGIGLSLPEFTACLSAQATTQIVDQSINDGVGAGVQGTPSTFILKKTRKGLEVVAMIDGARGKEFFEAAIQQALND